MTTLRRLVGVPELGLRVLAGHDALDRPVSWVAVSELADPAPYLEGGELVLTTGLNRAFDLGQAAPYVDLLVAAGAAGLGFGVGVAHDGVPPALVDAAAGAGLPLLEVDRPTPFIAVGKALADLLAAERGERARRELAGQQALAAARSGGGPQDVLDRLARLVGGWAVLLDPRDAVVLQAGPADDDAVLGTAVELAGRLRGRGRHASAASSGRSGRATALPVRAGDRTPGALVVGTPLGAPAAPAGLVAFAASLLGLDAGAPGGALAGWARAALVAVRTGLDVPAPPQAATGFPAGARLRVAVVHAGADDVVRRLGAASVPVAGDPSDPVVVPAGEDAVVVVAEPAGPALGALAGLSGGVADAVPPARLADAVAAASALARRSHGTLVRAGAAPTAVHDLLADRLPAFAETTLAPLRGAPGGDALLDTLRVWLSLHGQTVAAAEAMAVHRHTVRERLRRAAALLDRDLDDPQVRAELWIALTA